MAKQRRIRKMFEGHLHIRKDEMMRKVLPYTMQQCYAGVIMPNTAPAVTTPELAKQYHDEIVQITRGRFKAVMTGYLTEATDPGDVAHGYHAGIWEAMKFYPMSKKHGAGTTNAHNGVSDLRLCAKVFEKMERIGMPLLLHGERLDEIGSGEETDPYDREALFIEHDLSWLRETFPSLRIVLEHITTRKAAEFIAANGDPKLLCATVTAHHLVLDRRDVFRGGMNPVHHCMPVVKRTEHRQALRNLVADGHDFVFAGTDSAPHPRTAKEKACGCAAGIFTAHCAVELYAEVFDDLFDGKIDEKIFENFLSVNGPRFYGIEPSSEHLTLERSEWMQDILIGSGATEVWPFGYHPDPAQRHRFRFKLVG